MHSHQMRYEALVYKVYSLYSLVPIIGEHHKLHLFPIQSCLSKVKKEASMHFCPFVVNRNIGEGEDVVGASMHMDMQLIDHAMKN
jgi:hypothetical protein